MALAAVAATIAAALVSTARGPEPLSRGEYCATLRRGVGSIPPSAPNVPREDIHRMADEACKRGPVYAPGAHP